MNSKNLKTEQGHYFRSVAYIFILKMTLQFQMQDKKIYFNFFNVYLFLRETETECKWVGAEREGGTESEAGSRLRAVSTEPDAGLELMDREIMT